MPFAAETAGHREDLVGNDVVDLRDPETHPQAIHPRWDRRVLTETERRCVRDARSPHAARWRFWAAKEGAFKVARKLRPDLPFIPSSFVLHPMDERRGTVHHEIGRFDVSIDETEERVHVVATLEGAAYPRSVVDTVDAIDTVDGHAATRAGDRVRRLAGSALGAALGVSPSTIDFARDRGIPVAFSGGIRLPVDLSFSHHGRFVACAWVRRRE